MTASHPVQPRVYGELPSGSFHFKERHFEKAAAHPMLKRNDLDPCLFPGLVLPRTPGLFLLPGLVPLPFQPLPTYPSIPILGNFLNERRETG